MLFLHGIDYLVLVFGKFGIVTTLIVVVYVDLVVLADDFYLFPQALGLQGGLSRSEGCWKHCDRR